MALEDLSNKNQFKYVITSQIYCCGASGASEQQHKQDLRRIYIKGRTNCRIHHFLPQCIAFNHHFLPQCIAFNQTARRHLLPEFIARRTTRGCHTIEPYLMQRVKVCKSGRLIVTSNFKLVEFSSEEKWFLLKIID